MIVSPKTNNLGDGAYRIRFRARSTTSSAQTLKVVTLESQTSATGMQILETVNITDSFQEYMVNMPEGTHDYFGIAHGFGTPYRAIYVDDIRYEPIPSCIVPTGLTVSNVGLTTATVSWTATASSNTVGYTYEVRTSGLPGSGTEGLTFRGTTDPATTSANLSNLTAGIPYRVYVIANCAIDDSSFWTDGVTFAPNWCQPTYANGSSIHRITNVNIDEVSFTDHIPTYTSRDRTGITVPDLTIGDTYTFQVTTTGFTGMGIAIDFNNDGDFDGTNEVLALPEYIANGTQMYNATVTIPKGVYSGIYRMRVWNRLANAGGGNGEDPCGSYNYGTWADYRVNLIGGVVPDANNILHVKQDVDQSAADYIGDGSSWANALPELADALIWAREEWDDNGADADWDSENPLKIYVAKGVYKPLYHAGDDLYTTDGGRDNAFVMVPNVKLYGGFDPTVGISDLSHQRLMPGLGGESGTVLSGDFQSDDVISRDTEGRLLLKNQHENAHHVVIASGDMGTALLDGFTITGGNTDEDSPAFTTYGQDITWEYGGGVYNLAPSFTIRNLLISGNQSAFNGGGVFNGRNKALHMVNVAITSNHAKSSGGGVYADYPGTPSTFTQVTVAGNSADVEGEAVFGYGTLDIRNSIIWGTNHFNGQPVLKSSLVEGRSDTGDGNIDASGFGAADVFTSPANGDFTLKNTSPAINMGNNTLYTATGGDLANDADLAGSARLYDGNPINDLIDMGAYEFQGEPIPTIVQHTDPEPVEVPYGTALEDIEGLPTSVLVALSNGSEDVTVTLDGNTNSWTLLDPVDGAYDGDVAGTYVFSVPLVLPEEGDDFYFTNPDELQAVVTIVVNKGTPVLTALWNEASIDAGEGLSLTYGDRGTLAFRTTDPEGSLNYHIGYNGTPVLDTEDLESVLALRAGTATLTVQQPASANYGAASLEFDVTVAQKVISIVPQSGQGKVYGADEPGEYGYELAEGDALAFDDELTDVVSTASREAGEDVDAYDIKLAFEGEQAVNYAVAFEANNNSFVVTPLAITVTAADQTKVFGTDDPALTYAYTPGLVGDDAFTGGVTRAEGEDVGTYTIMQGDLSADDNYEITFEAGTLTITPADYEGIELNDLTVVYDGSEHVLELTGELHEGATVSYDINGKAGNGATDAGIYEITALMHGGTNYQDAELTATLEITPLEITVTAADKSKTFGATEPLLTYTATPGLIGDDTFTGALTREPGEVVGTYTIQQGSLSAGGNYTISFEPADLAITKASITGIAFADGSFVYNGTAHSLAIEGELPTGATVTYEIDGEVSNGTTDAGTYEVKAIIDGGDNYEDTELMAMLTVVPLEITVAAANKTKVFGAADPVLTYAATPGLIGDDTFTGALTREPGEDVGSYTIRQGNLSAGGNYEMTLKPAILTINKASISGIHFEDVTYIYQGTVGEILLKGDLPDGTEVTYSNNRQTDAGTYEATATVSGDNYEMLVLQATLTITPAERSIDFPPFPVKTYGDRAFEAGGTASSGEAVLYMSSDPAVAEVNQSGRITITGAGAAVITATVPANGNYTGRPEVSRTLVVDKSPQTISFTDVGEVHREIGTVQLDVSASSGLPVSLSVDDPEVATVEGVTLHVHRLGTVRIKASQAGGGNHEAARPVTITVRVVDPESELPVRVSKVVSPNGDGINEFLIIEGIKDQPDNRVRIFNRNGTVLYEAKGYNNGNTAFRGISTGRQRLPAGTYFYVAEIRVDGTWKYEKGWFLLRY